MQTIDRSILTHREESEKHLCKTVKKKNEDGPDRGSNPEPLAPKARIIPLDHQATLSPFAFLDIDEMFVFHPGGQDVNRRTNQLFTDLFVDMRDPLVYTIISSRIESCSA